MTCTYEISAQRPLDIGNYRRLHQDGKHLIKSWNRKAQGYSIWQSPAGADGGADILAGSGPMGFGEQGICVEVKSGSGLVDRPTVDKLLGAMTKFNATQGLFVAWGGFRANVQKERF